MNSSGIILGPGGQRAGAGGAGDGGADGEVVETTTQTFARDVLEPSREVPVLVDFWAPWCGPCKQLAPVLEKAVKAAKGAVKLVKMNIDEHPAVAGQLGIQSIPAVIAFRNGQPFDGFMGAVPESQIKEFIARIAGPAPSGAADLVAEGDRLRAEGQTEEAARHYMAALEEDREDAGAFGGLAACYVDLGELDEARRILSMLPAEMKAHAAVQSAEAALKLKEEAASLGPANELEARLAKDPRDHGARFDLALQLSAQGFRDEAVDHLLEIVRHDREWNEDAARRKLVELFEAWGPKDPATVRGRRRLSSLMFA